MKTVIVSQSDPDAIAQACDILDMGGIVLHPTSTAYGLAVDATNEDAVDRLNNVCMRTTKPYKPYIVIVNGIEMARQLGEIDKLTEELMLRYWPGPLTLILKKTSNIIDPARFGSTEVAIRHDSHAITQALSTIYPNPYTSTSANPSGGPTPYSVDEALSQFKEGDIDLVIDAGKLPLTPASTIVDCTKEELVVVRQGAVIL